MEHKKYREIERLKENNSDTFKPGDHIIITEKIDGSNATIGYDNGIVAMSRNRILTFDNTNRGFYEFANRLDAEKVNKLLGSRYLLSGEWAVPHTVVYPKESQNNMYVFDLYDTETKTYLDMHQAFLVADTLGLPKVAVFYEGEFISWEHCMSFVGKTALGGEYGEGIVIHGDDGKIIKIVSDRFAETKKIKKTPTPEELAAQSQAYELAKSIVTEARVRKIINKLVDEGILPENWNEHDLKTMSQYLPKRVFEDCMKEEPETANLIKKDFGKLSGKISMTYARSFTM